MLVRFTDDALNGLSDVASRHYLTEIGLPADHRLCRARPPGVTALAQGGVKAIALGETDGGTLCVNAATGAIFVMGDYGGMEWYANASIEQFGKSLAVFDSQYPFHAGDADFDTLLAAADAFEAAISAVDPSAIAPQSFWQDVSAEISNGDYGERTDRGSQ